MNQKNWVYLAIPRSALLVVAIICAVLAALGPVVAYHLPRGWFQFFTYAEAVGVGGIAAILFWQWLRSRQRDLASLSGRSGLHGE